VNAKPVIYLDANASEPLRPEARAAMLAALDLVGKRKKKTKTK
jgi:cysteine sulfinate desulfinase/cysteine desulfurase-like protein